jgi:hypothetical protein
MKRKRKSAVVTGLIVAVLGVFLTGAARAPVSHAATTPAVFTDTVGDSGGAADIQDVTLSDTGGVVTFTIHAPGFVHSPADGGETAIAAWFDTDKDLATGDFEGADYGLVTLIDDSGAHQLFLKLDEASAKWVEITSPTMTYSADAVADTYSFTFGSADFGNAAAFDFYVRSSTWAGGTDIAPSPGEDWWTYELTQQAPSGDYTIPRPIWQLFDGSMYLFADGEYHQISQAQFTMFGLSTQAFFLVGELYAPVGAPATDEQVQVMEQEYVQALNDMGVEATVPSVKLPAPSAPPAPAPAPAAVESPVINVPLTLPATPKAGKVFTVSFPITSSLTGQKLATGTMICDPQVKGKVIKHDEHFTNGKATLRFTIPATAKGKLLKVHLTMVLGNQSTTRVTTFLVR